MGTSPPMNETKSYDNRLEAQIVCALAFLFLPVAVLATAQTWVLAVAGVLAILVIRAIQGRFRLRADIILVSLMVLLAGWAAFSAVWSITPDRAIKSSIRIALVFASLVVLIDAARNLDHNQRRRFGHCLVGGTVAGLVLTGIFVISSDIVSVWLGDAKLTGKELSSFNRTSTVIAVLVWPVALVIAQMYNRYAAAAVIVISALMLFALAPSTPLVAFAVGLIAFVIAWFSHRWGKRFLILAFAGSVIMIPLLDLVMPVLTDFLLAHIPWPNSEIHRLVIWQFAAERIFEHPLIGWGLDASRAIPGGHTELFLYQIGTNPVTGQAMPLHPHNALVQIWLELGLVGIMIVGAIFSFAVASIPESNDNHAGPATLIATAACAFTIAQLGFGIWQGWWMATLGLIVMIATAISLHKPVPVAPREERGESA
jgi:exopolysaccharide production protein ExoQ